MLTSDGFTDITSSLNQLLKDALPGTTINLPTSEFKVEGTITIPTGVTVNFSGSIIHLTESVGEHFYGPGGKITNAHFQQDPKVEDKPEPKPKNHCWML